MWASVTGKDAHRLLVSWDAQWYKGIAENGYGFVRIHEDGRVLSDYAFFPLFGWLERWVSAATGLAAVDAGLLVSWVSSLVAAWGIFAVGDHLYGRRVGVLLTVLWASLPIGIVTSMAYSESTFTALAAWSLYAVITRRWLIAGVLAALAGLTRPIGVAVVAALVITAVVVLLQRRETGTWWRVLVGTLIAPLGWLGYVGWVGLETGSPLGYFEVAGEWGNGFDGGVAFTLWIWDFLDSSSFILGLLLCAGVAALGWLFVLCIRARFPLPLLVFCGVLLFLTLTTSGYFGSKPRYLLPAFPLLLPVAVALARLSLRRVVPVLVLMASASAVYGAYWLHGAGPP